MMHVWSKFNWGFQLKIVMSYRADKVKFTDRGMDIRTGVGNNTPSPLKAKG